MEENIYAPPNTTEPAIIEETGSKLATRLERLGASLLDSIFMSLITLPVMYFTGGLTTLVAGEDLSLLYTVFFAIFSVLSFSSFCKK